MPEVPPNVPKLVILPLLYRKASLEILFVVPANPVTSPPTSTATAML
jgi:hypothetical protein